MTVSMTGMILESVPQEAPVERTKNCFRSRLWYLLPAAICGCSAVARYAGGEVGDYAGTGAVSGVAIGILMSLGRVLTAGVQEGCVGASRACEAGFLSYMEPESVGSNSVFALAPWAFCFGIGVKTLIQKEESPV